MPTSRTHRSRGQARRDALLQATVEVAAEAGMAGVTHRAVTERAGVPLATVSYFFDSIDALAEEALEVFTRRHVDELTALGGLLEQQSSSPDEVAAAFAAAAAPREPETLAMMEAFLHAARRPERRAAVAAALVASQAVVDAGLRAAGVPPDLAADAAAFIALGDGYALHQLAVPDQADPAALHRALRALLLGFLLDRGHTELALELAGQSAGA